MYTQDMLETVELLLSNRLYLYTVFHKVYGREPDSALLEILSSDEMAQAFRILSEEEDDTMERAAVFTEDLKNVHGDEEWLSLVRLEYMKLFVGPDKLIAPPWESVYRSKQGLLFQESTLTIRDIYQKYGLHSEGYPRVADDSLALELNFMVHLADRTLELFRTHADMENSKIKELLDEQSSFLKVHLLFWIPKLLERVSKSRTSLLYPKMTRILLEVLQKDYELLAEISQLGR